MTRMCDMDAERGLIEKLVIGRRLVLYGLHHFKVLGGEMNFVSHDGRWHAVQGRRVVAQADRFDTLWEMVEGEC